MTQGSSFNGQIYPKGWTRYKLGDICKITAKQVDPKVPCYGNLPHVNGENIESGTCKLLFLKTAAELGMTSGKYLFEPGNVLYSKLRPYLRKALHVNFEGVCSADMYPIKANDESLVPEFLSWMLISDNFTNYADEQSRRARMPKLNRKQLFDWETAIPNIQEQKRIVEILNDRLAAVDKARAAAEAQLEAAKALPAAYLRQIFDSPEAQTWPRKKLGDIAKTCSGATPSRKRTDYYQGTIPWVKTGELRDGVIEDVDEYITELALKETSVKLLPERTLLIAMYGQGQTRGRTGLLTKPATTNQACFAIQPNDKEFDPRFIQLWFRHNYLKLRGKTEGRGGNQSNLNGQLLKAQEINLPNPERQKEAISEISTSDLETEKLISSLNSQLDDINQIPAALLRQAFNGEL